MLWDFWNPHLCRCPKSPPSSSLGALCKHQKGIFLHREAFPGKTQPCSPWAAPGRAGCLRDSQQPQGIRALFSPPCPGTLCSGLVISQLNISQGWSHHLVWFKVKLPEWDGRTDLFFLALLPPFSPAQQKKKNIIKKNRQRELCMHIEYVWGCACLCECFLQGPILPGPLLLFKP